MNRTVTHSGDPRLARHVVNALLRVDFAVAAMMVHSRAVLLARKPLAALYVEGSTTGG